ncbi:GNAT family N-acetyltransferase [Gordonia shandongensis]|uniref:GNAT family N-acetyltransferase n=1 Tax=Gordonia shandongensis TaxID=376351 RepID=UPI0003FB6AE6|nr:GNAT family N-acetyltransferase [Gordonia shandongensis]
MTNTTADERVEVTRNDELGRFDITVNGEAAGFTEFVDMDGLRVFPHTELDDRFSGRGLSSTLVAAALDDTRRADLEVVPVCPLVLHYLEKRELPFTRPTPSILNSLGRTRD